MIEIIKFQGILEKNVVNKILKCNEYTKKYGLKLREAEILQLIKKEKSSLKDNGRIEFGEGIIEKIIKEFCDSPYIFSTNYLETLEELLSIFYYYKNESLELISDDELIEFMHEKFDGVCEGSLELLSERELYKMVDNLKSGLPIDYIEEEGDEDNQYD